jgi:hypothetical protein
MNIKIMANQVQPGDWYAGRQVVAVDAGDLVTLLHFGIGEVLPFMNTVSLLVERVEVIEQ